MKRSTSRPTLIVNQSRTDSGPSDINPTLVMISESNRIADDHNWKHGWQLGCVVSIGCGPLADKVPSDSDPTWKRFYMLHKKIVKSDTAFESVHQTVEYFARDHDFGYHRFNITQSFGDVKLDAIHVGQSSDYSVWAQADAPITTVTNQYLSRPDIQGQIRGVAQMLVENRRKKGPLAFSI